MNKAEKYVLMGRMSQLLGTGMTFKQLHEKLLDEKVDPDWLVEICKKNEDFGSVSNIHKVLKRRAIEVMDQPYPQSPKMLMRTFIALKCKGTTVDFKRMCSIIESHAKIIDSSVPSNDWSYKYSRDLLEKAWSSADQVSREIYGKTLINQWG